MAGWGDDSDGGGGGGWGGSSNGAKTATPKYRPQRDLIRTISRLNAVKNPKKRALIHDAIGEALQGYKPQQITNLGRKAGLEPGDINQIVLAAGAKHIQETGADFGPVPAVLDYLDRATGRPIKAAIVEGRGGRDPLAAVKGLYHGSVEGKSYPGAQAGAALVTGKSPKETAQIRQDLPGFVRTAADFGVDVLVDWSNYLTFGSGILADTAARSVAKGLARQAAEDTVLNQTAQAIYEQILAKGAKALTKEQRRSLPRGVARKLDRAVGGARIAGQRIPGTAQLNRKLNELGVKPGGALSGLEADVRLRAEVRQAERAKSLPKGTTQNVENILARQRGAEFVGGLAPTRAVRGAEEIVGRTVGGKAAGSRAAIRAGRRILDADPEILNRVRNTLDVGGGAAARAALPKGERELADYLRAMSDADFEALQRVGRLRSDEQMADLVVSGVPRTKQTGRLARLVQKAQKASDAQAERVAALEAKGAEFRNIPAIQRPVSGDLGPSLHAAEDVKLAEQYGKAISKQQILDRRLRGLQQTLARLKEEAPVPVPQEQYLYHPRLPEHPKGVFARRKQQAFLQPRSLREPIGGVEGYVQDPRISMGLHAKGTAQEVATVDAWRQLEMMGPESAPLSIRTGEHVPGMPSRIEEFKARTPDWEKHYEEVKVPLLHGSGRASETALIRKEVLPYFKQVTRGLESRTIRRNVEYLNALWARMATGTLGFVSRNVLQGNLYMGVILGEARNPLVWARSLGTMKRMQQGITRLGDPYAFVTAGERELVEGAIRDNAVESGFLDVIQAQSDEAVRAAGSRTAKALKGSKFSPASPNFYGWAPISKANQWMENWSRLSVYANKVNQGWASPEAAAVTRRVMLDYKDLAPLNETARLVNPFLTWTYKSAPLIAGTLARDPRKVKVPLALLNAVNAEGRRSEGVGVTPQWQVDAGAVTLPKGLRTSAAAGLFGLDKEPQAFIPASPIHTTVDTAKILTDLTKLRKPGGWQEAGGSFINLIGAGGVPAGLVKAAAEAFAGKQFYSGRVFQPGQRVPTPLPLQPFFGKTMPWEAWNTLNTLLPVLSRSGTVAPQGPYEKATQGRKILGQVAGVSVYPQGKKAVSQEAARRNDQLAALVRSLRDQGVKVPRKTKTVKSSVSSSSGGLTPYPGR